MTIVQLTVLALVVGAVLVHAWLRSQADQRELDRVWKLAAERLGGKLTRTGGSWLQPVSRALTAAAGSVSVRVDHYAVSQGNSSSHFTRAVAMSPGPPELWLRVAPFTFLTRVETMLISVDVPTGDRRFDEAFLVKSNDPHAARLWLDEKMRGVISTNGGSFELKEGRVELVVPGLLRSSRSLTDLVTAAACFSDRRSAVVRAWTQFARRLDGQVHRCRGGWARVRGSADGLTVTLETSWAKGDKPFAGSTHTGLSVSGPLRHLVPFALAKQEGQYHGDLPRQRESRPLDGYLFWTVDPQRVTEQLDDELVARIQSFEASLVRVEAQRIVVAWPGICVEADRLERALDLALCLARSGRTGPYR